MPVLLKHESGTLFECADENVDIYLKEGKWAKVTEKQAEKLDVELPAADGAKP